MIFKKIAGAVWDYLVMTLGAFLYSVAWDWFMIPNDMADGGLTGACTILQFATGIPVAYSFAVVNSILLILAFVLLGKGVGIRTIFCIALSTFMLDFFARPEFAHMRSLPGNFLYVDNMILVPVIGAFLEAVGITMILERGGSTGGTDIFALIFNKFWPVSLGQVYLYTDLVIIASIILVPGHTFSQMMYGYLAMITFSFVVDFMTVGKKSTAQVMIFSSKYEQIADFIINDLERGVTVVKSIGWYTKEDRDVLMIYVRKREVRTITKAVKAVDPKAFVAVSPASSVFGEGFDKIKTGMNLNLITKKNGGSEN